MPKREILKSVPSEDCFGCTMTLMEQDIVAAGAMNWKFANETFRRLKSTLKIYGPSESDNLTWSACNLHSQNYMAVLKGLWSVIELLMASLEDLNQRDGTLAAELLRLAYYFTDSYKTVRCRCFSVTRTYISKNPLLSEYEFRQLLKAAYSVQHPVIVHNHSEYDNKQHIVWLAIMDSHEQLLSALLRYGVMFLPATQFNAVDLMQMDAALRCLDGHATRSFILHSHNTFPEIFRHQFCWPLHRVIIVLRVLRILSFEVCKRSKAELEDDSSGGKRPRLEGRGEGSTSSSVHFRCLRRAFETIPEPFVTSEELRCVFQVAYDHMDERTETRINGAIAMFENMYPEGADPLSPRTLQHLSRCQVRQNLRQTGALPHGIRYLGLPNKIRKYIVLDE